MESKEKTKPRKKCISFSLLSYLMRLWIKGGVSKTRCVDLLLLYLGDQYKDIMDLQGRWPRKRFNDLRKAMRYSCLEVMLADIKRTHSFILTGENPELPLYIFSPNWHAWTIEDGPKIFGSLDVTKQGNLVTGNGHAQRLLLEDCNIEENNPTGSRPEGLGADAQGDAKGMSLNDQNQHTIDELSRYRHQAVREYFEWVMQQTDPQYLNLQKLMLEAIRRPRNQYGRIEERCKMDDEQVEIYYPWFVEHVLIPYFSQRDDFFDRRSMENPGRRIFWMKCFFKRYVGEHIIRAHPEWLKARREMAKTAVLHEQSRIRSNHPRTPYEWEDPQGNRFYADDQQLAIQIPPDAPDRPDDSCYYSTILKQWITTKSYE